MPNTTQISCILLLWYYILLFHNKNEINKYISAALKWFYTGICVDFKQDAAPHVFLQPCEEAGDATHLCFFTSEEAAWDSLIRAAVTFNHNVNRPQYSDTCQHE